MNIEDLTKEIKQLKRKMEQMESENAIQMIVISILFIASTLLIGLL